MVPLLNMAASRMYAYVSSLLSSRGDAQPFWMPRSVAALCNKYALTDQAARPTLEESTKMLSMCNNSSIGSALCRDTRVCRMELVSSLRIFVVSSMVKNHQKRHCSTTAPPHKAHNETKRHEYGRWFEIVKRRRHATDGGNAKFTLCAQVPGPTSYICVLTDGWIRGADRESQTGGKWRWPHQRRLIAYSSPSEQDHPA